MSDRNSNLLRALFALAVLTACCLAGPAAQAQEEIRAQASYRLSIATTAGLVDDPHDDLNMLEATWRTPSDVLLSRRNPIVKLENTSPDDFNLLNFTLDINDPNFVFDAMLILDAPGGVAPIITAPSDIVHSGSTSSRLEFDFGDRPLAPGESITFIVEIEPALGAPNVQADFRNILWDKFGSDRDDNALLSASFDKGPFPEFVMGDTFDLPIIPFYEYPFDNEQFDTRDSDGASGKSTIIPSMGMKSGDLGYFEINQQGIVVPEPTSCLTMLIGLLLLTARTLFRRKRPQR